MDKIIVVYGHSSVGKTTVINDIYNKLISNGATVVSKKKQVGGNKNDFKAELSYNEKKVAILSMGDRKKTVDDCVGKYKGCDVFITALNMRFATVGSVWLKNSNAIYKIEKTMANNADNQKVLNAVIAKI